MAFVNDDKNELDDDEDAVDDDEDDIRPADVAKSFNFCDRPTLCGFIANEWCAITVCGSIKFVDDDVAAVAAAIDGEIYLQTK